MVFAAGLALLALSLLLPAQEPASKIVAVRGGRILPVSGAPIDAGTVLLEGTKIRAVGKDVAIPAGAVVIDASGKVVIPGLIDAGSTLFVPFRDAATAGSAEHDVVDGLEAFGEEHLEALEGGVTTVLVRPLARGTFGGLEAVLRLGAGPDPARFVVRRAAAVKMTLGFSGGDSATAVQRQADYRAARQSFEAARQYKEVLEKYRKDLEEYEQKKKQWDEQQKPAPPKAEPPKPPAAGQEPPKADPAKPAPLKEEPKKPQKPRPDPRNEVLVQAMDGKLAVHVEAHAADSILHALSLAEEFKLRVVLEGATEAHLAAGAIAKAKVPVIAGPVFRYGIPKVDFLRHTPACAAALAREGVEVALGSFPSPAAGHAGPGAGRFLLEAAACAAGRGLPRDQALRAVTLGAAKILGMDAETGSLDAGKSADLVILSGEPFEAGTVVERTIVAGETRYLRKGE